MPHIASSEPLERVVSEADNPSAEHELVGRLRAGEAAAYEELVRTAGGRMLSVARRMLGNETDAEDAVQEAFVSAFRSLEKFDEQCRLTTWLHRIVVNACLMKLRTARRRPECSLEALLPRFLEDGHSETTNVPWKPEAMCGIQIAERRALVCAKIDELPDTYREVLVLRDVEGVDTEQTAELLGLTPSAVKTRLHRARQALRTLLAPHLSQEPAPAS